jgi:hypothetical protein
MQRNTVDTNAEQNYGKEKISKRMAYHQAGYAAAIYLGNQQKKLPPIHFQVVIKPQIQDEQLPNRLAKIFEGIFNRYEVIVEGGRLIQHLPLCFSEAAQHLSRNQQAEYRCAFESDVTNILAGSLAEAKYIALRDDESFNSNLISLNALRYYSSTSDIELIDKYMKCYLVDEAARGQKLEELFLAAFSFVGNNNNWRKISTLADFIQSQTNAGTIHCKEVTSLLDSEVSLSKNNLLDFHAMQFSR